MKQSINYWSDRKVYIYRTICFCSLALATLWAILIFSKISGNYYGLFDHIYMDLSMDELLNTSMGRSVIAEIKSGTTGLTLCESLCLLVFIFQSFYLRKITSAYLTIRRLPKKKRVIYEIYKTPVIAFALAFLFKILYTFACILRYWFAGVQTRNMALAILKNFWRIIL